MNEKKKNLQLTKVDQQPLALGGLRELGEFGTDFERSQHVFIPFYILESLALVFGHPRRCHFWVSQRLNLSDESGREIIINKGKKKHAHTQWT